MLGEWKGMRRGLSCAEEVAFIEKKKKKKKLKLPRRRKQDSW